MLFLFPFYFVNFVRTVRRGFDNSFIEITRYAFLWNTDFRRGSKTWWKSECRRAGNICWRIGCGCIWRWFTGGWLGWRLGCGSSCPPERQRGLVLYLSRNCCCFFMGCRSRPVKFIKHRWSLWTGRLVFCFFLFFFFFSSFSWELK